jgi:hypothetical protein
MGARIELVKREFGTNEQNIGFGEIAARISVAFGRHQLLMRCAARRKNGI